MNAVTSDKIADGHVTTAKLAAGAVTSESLADGSVTTAKLAADALQPLVIDGAGGRVGIGGLDALDRLHVLQDQNDKTAIAALNTGGGTTVYGLYGSASGVGPTTSVGVYGEGKTDGVFGKSLASGGAGVTGSNAQLNGYGVYAQSSDDTGFALFALGKKNAFQYSGAVGIQIHADSDGTGAVADNPFLKTGRGNPFSVDTVLGTVGTVGQDPDGMAYSGTIAGASLLGTFGAKALQLGTNANVRLSLTDDGALAMPLTAAPGISALGEGRIYFDSGAAKFKVSQAGGVYEDLVGSVSDGAVTSVKLAAGAVTTAKLGDAAVTTKKLASDALSLGKVTQAIFSTSGCSLYTVPAGVRAIRIEAIGGGGSGGTGACDATNFSGGGGGGSGAYVESFISAPAPTYYVQAGTVGNFASGVTCPAAGNPGNPGGASGVYSENTCATAVVKAAGGSGGLAGQIGVAGKGGPGGSYSVSVGNFITGGTRGEDGLLQPAGSGGHGATPSKFGGGGNGAAGLGGVGGAASGQGAGGGASSGNSSVSTSSSGTGGGGIVVIWEYY